MSATLSSVDFASMNKQVRHRQSSRVADYFVTVGIDEELIPLSEAEQLHKESPNDPIKTSYAVDILDRYPLDDHEDFPLPHGIALFCFPLGCEISENDLSPTFFSFVISCEDGSRVMGCCLRFYEPMTPMQRASLLDRYKEIEEKDSATSSSTKIDSRQSFYYQNQAFYVPRCICLISSWPFVLAFKSFLSELYRSSTIQPSEDAARIPLERYICNFIDDVPAPPWGRVDVSYYFKDQVILFRCPPHNEPNAWSSLPLFPLLECLSPENILALFSLVLTERQIILISSQYSLLTYCAEAITSLIYPITWAHAYIPILPFKLIGNRYF